LTYLNISKPNAYRTYEATLTYYFAAISDNVCLYVQQLEEHLVSQRLVKVNKS